MKFRIEFYSDFKIGILDVWNHHNFHPQFISVDLGWITISVIKKETK